MKAKDLMIGDWVYDTILKGNTKVEMLSLSGIKGDFHENVCDENTFEPIPLTPEILEKNGFGFIKNDNTKSVWNGWWIYKDLELGVCCLDRIQNWPCFINIDDANIKCEYVHQLQHALRLCGIEKEIEL